MVAFCTQSNRVSRNLFGRSTLQQPSHYEILVVRLPSATVPLGQATPMGHSIAPHHANTEAEALAKCRNLLQDGYGVEVKGPNVRWDQAEVLQRLNLRPSYLMSRRATPGAD
jgi:hypothetical protein